MITTLREYSLIIFLLLALAATGYLHFGKLLTGLTERTVAQVRGRG